MPERRIRGLLLDLDNTLLTIDVDAFVEAYSEAVARALVPDDAQRGLAVLTGATYRLLMTADGADSNRDRLLAALAHDLERPGPDVWEDIEAASRSILPSLQSLGVPVAHAQQTIREARRRGLAVALATNPIYPRSVIVERMAWAGVAPGDVDVIACLETCRATKPHAAYFRELAEGLGLAATDCLMVGDDPDQDLPARAAGSYVHLVENGGAVHGDDGVRSGPLHELFTIWQDRLATVAIPPQPR